MEGKMTRRTTTTAITGLLIVLAIAVPAAAAEPQPNKASDDIPAQIKAAQDERIAVLTRLVEVLTGQYKTGTVDAAQVFSAENELCNAMLDSSDEPEKRVALLTKHLDKANDFLKSTQARVDSGTASVADAFRAKSLYLDIKIKLLRERSRKRPPATIPTEKQP